MGEETLRADLTSKQVTGLVVKLKESQNFKVIHAAKNLWYVGLKSDVGSLKSIHMDGEFTGLLSPTYVGIIRKSSAGLFLYKDSDSRTEKLRGSGCYDQLREIVRSI